VTVSVAGATGSRVKVWAWRIGFVAAVALQLYGVYTPREAGPHVGIPGIDKVAHLFLFGSVAFLGLMVRIPARWLLGALVANAIVSELVQYWVLPQRDGDPFDVLADLAGVAVGAWLAFRVIRRTP
jgi:VanZ family protein